MRRAAVIAAALAFAPAAAGAPPAVTATQKGLTITLAADSAVHWDFGDGQSGDGSTVVHAYARPGLYTVTATGAGGETAQAQVTARTVTLTRPRVVGYGHRLTFRGAIIPPGPGRVTLFRAGGPLGSVRARPDGSFRITARIALPGGYTVAAGGLRSKPVPVIVRPLLQTSFRGSAAVGGSLQLRAQLHPAGGRLAVTLFRDGKLIGSRTFGPAAILNLDTSKPATLRLRLRAIAAPGYAPVTKQLAARVIQPNLAVGTVGPSVAMLTTSLAALHYVVPRTTAFDSRVLDALYAFQKVEGLPRTGIADAPTWAALSHAHTARPRYARPASHLEIDKVHQVLYVVRRGAVAGIVPVSTAGLAGTFTPVGRFAIYRKVTGFDPSPLGTLFDPMYFTGGYAVHGNPSVPPYPASHGCVRVPMWVAPLLYETNDYGETVYVY
jgi:lipoprotein-anchoring transpeptidase ErfK/SrfK